jgi:hypothetical protein
LLPKAAHYSWRRVFLAPVRFRFASYVDSTSHFWESCTDDQIYDVFWRHRNFTVKITYSRSRFDFPNTRWTSRTPPWWQFVNMFTSLVYMYSLCRKFYVWTLAVCRNIFQGKMKVWSQITMCFGRYALKLEANELTVFKLLNF